MFLAASIPVSTSTLFYSDIELKFSKRFQVQIMDDPSDVSQSSGLTTTYLSKSSCDYMKVILTMTEL